MVLGGARSQVGVLVVASAFATIGWHIALRAPARQSDAVASEQSENPVFRHAGISYLRIPAPNARELGAFYREVFEWKVDTGRPDPSFEDGTGHVIGHFIPDARPAGEAGVRPYVYVDNVVEVLGRVAARGGTVVEQAYPEGNLTVATFRDPAGNVIGVWQLAAAG